MKKNLILKGLVALLAICLIFPTNSFSQRIYTGIEADNYFSGTEMVRESNQSDLPSYISFREHEEIDVDLALNWIKKNFELSPQTGFQLIRAENDFLGYRHYRYQQTFNGQPIEHAIWIIHTMNDKVESMNGLLYKTLTNPGSASLSESDALNNALNHVGATTYKWELAHEEEHLKHETNDESASYFPQGELVYIPYNGNVGVENYRLAYKFNVYAHEPVSRADIYVDASSGEIIFENKVIKHVDTPGTAATAYSGNQTIIADSFGGGYRLNDNSRGDGVNTYDMNEGTNYGSAVDFTDADNFWNNANAELDEYATDAHWGAEMTYDYFWTIHGRNSIDNSGFQLNSYIHYDVSYANAFWDGNRMTYGDGNATWNPLTSVDIAGHEIAHGLTTFTANLVYNAESGALNESFSDIFGNSIENFARPGQWSWLVGEDIGSALRSMSNPNAYGDPDTYFGTNWASLTGGDNGGVHTNSGVQNFWYYLLTDGGSGTNDNGDSYNVTGLGFADAGAIAFRNLTVYLTSSSQYADARFYAIQSAVDLFGSCSPEVESTTNAWYAVGVGVPYTAGVTANFDAPSTSSCSAPFTVDFNNLSSNGTTFVWDFGDGGSSTTNSPSYTYNTPGTYTVTLDADGGACGNDQTVQVAYIIIDNALPCEVTLPTSGAANTQTECSGIIHDSGGAGGNYGPNEDAVITISPIGAATVDITFSNFDVEPGTGSSCDYDWIEVYDGPNTSSPLIDTYCNNNIPGVVSSTGGDITVVFHSDGGLEMSGFQIDWTCVLPTTPPVASFNSNVQSTCNGVVAFSDLSTNGPTSWSWDFGDGNTSSDQNPTHTYTSSGTYTVELTSTNSFGNDLVTLTDYITVNLPVGPSTTDDNICENNSANLSASGTGTLNWYDAPTGGILVNTGATYTTPNLSTTTTYYVQEEVPGANENVGPIDNSFGGGGNFNGDQHLLFDVTAPKKLISVDVIAQGAGNRTIELRNSSGVVIESLIVNIPNGASTVTLDFDLAVGSDWELGTENGSNPSLYRNNSGPVYPYTAGSGDVSITQSSAGTDYYYFFYNWVLEDYECLSEMTAVNANVSPESDATITPPGAFCTGDGAMTLTSVDAGGVWTGPGMSGATFDPTSAGTGTHEIIYTISGSCGDADTVLIPVASGFDATISPTTSMCTGDAIINLTAADIGGTWTGAGITDGVNGTFDPSIAGVGTHTITYTIAGSCGDTDTETISVSASQDATIASTTDICESDGTVNLTASDPGGLWSSTCGSCIDGSTGVFDPSLTTCGTHTITYTLSGTCGDTDTEDLIVLCQQDATITPVTDLCDNETPVNLIAVDGGGTWSGSGVNIDTFNPTVAGEGTHTITYTIGGTCGDTDTQDIIVMAAPDATINPATGVICRNEGVQTITSVETGGTWSADCGTCIDPVTGEFDPTVSGDGVWTITYSIDNGTCSDNSSTTVSVVDCLGLGEDDVISFSIYPNPTNNYITIQTSDITEGKIEITNMLGQFIYVQNFNSNITTIDLNNIVADGTYFIRLKDAQGNLIGIQKLIKN